MKRNNVAKRFGIASLCLATALSAFSGIASQKNNVALAEGTVAVTDFVHTTAGTVEKTSERSSTSKTTTKTTGLRLKSDTAYEGTFKTVFSGDTTLNFRFPEVYNTTTKEYYGDFRIRVADVDDDSKYFEVVYYVGYSGKNPYTNMYLSYNSGKRASKYDGSEWYQSGFNTNNNYVSGYPCFGSYCGGSSRELYEIAYLTLDWDDAGVLSVRRKGVTKKATVLAAFDGTTKFTNKSDWGLPTLEDFKDGYTISFSSNITAYYDSNKGSGATAASPQSTDKGTDAFFTTISTNDGATTYNLSGDTITVDEGMTKFNDTFATEAPETGAGEVFLGWKGADGLYAGPSGAMAHNLVRKSAYEAVVIGYDTINGASVRIDTKDGKSGIRFMTTFDKDDYAAVEQYITEKGTLVAVTSALDESIDFTIENYQDVIDANGSVKKVTNTKEVYDYTAKNGTTYTAYSMAITFENVSADYYTIAYSARGYLVVTYADGSTATIYTDYNAGDNSRSIAQTAKNLIENGAEEFATYNDNQKAIVNAYASALN